MLCNTYFCSVFILANYWTVSEQCTVIILYRLGLYICHLILLILIVIVIVLVSEGLNSYNIIIIIIRLLLNKLYVLINYV